MSLTRALFGFVLFMLVCCCGQAQIFSADSTAYYSSPAVQGINTEVLNSLYSYINKTSEQPKSVVLLKNGFVVSESYQIPVYKNVLFDLYSCTKGIVAILTGVAIKQGFIQSVDQPVTDFILPGEIQNTDSLWGKIRIRDLLSMQSGLMPDDSEIHFKSAVAMFENRRVAFKPGTQFQYGDLDPQLLVCILEKATKMPLQVFAEKYLFQPLGIKRYDWQKFKGTCIGSTGLRLSAIDIAKLGWLMTDSGRWNNNQLILPEYWAQATVDQTGSGFGFMWWVLPTGGFAGIGHDCQYILCSPASKLCFVFTSTTNDSIRAEFLEAINKNYIMHIDQAAGSALKENNKAELVQPVYPKVKLPGWLAAFNNSTLEGNLGNQPATLSIQNTGDSVLTLRLDNGKSEINISAGNGQKQFSVSDGGANEEDEVEHNYIHLVSHIQSGDGEIKILSSEIYTNASYSTLLYRKGRNVFLDIFVNGKNKLCHFSGKVVK